MMCGNPVLLIQTETWTETEYVVTKQTLAGVNTKRKQLIFCTKYKQHLQ